MFVCHLRVEPVREGERDVSACHAHTESGTRARRPGAPVRRTSPCTAASVAPRPDHDGRGHEARCSQAYRRRLPHPAGRVASAVCSCTTCVASAGCCRAWPHTHTYVLAPTLPPLARSSAGGRWQRGF